MIYRHVLPGVLRVVADAETMWQIGVISSHVGPLVGPDVVDPSIEGRNPFVTGLSVPPRSATRSTVVNAVLYFRSSRQVK